MKFISYSNNLWITSTAVVNSLIEFTLPKKKKSHSHYKSDSKNVVPLIYTKLSISLFFFFMTIPTTPKENADNVYNLKI